MSAEDTEEIVTQPVQLSEEEALKQVETRFLARIKSSMSGVDPVRAALRYKPFYAYEVTLTKRVFRDDDVVREGYIIVDAMANVARPFTTEEIEETEACVPVEQKLDSQISQKDALVTANSRRMQVEHREGGNMDLVEEPTLVYKPVWLVELTNDDVRVVDGVDGTVFGDMVIG